MRPDPPRSLRSAPVRTPHDLTGASRRRWRPRHRARWRSLGACLVSSPEGSTATASATGRRHRARRANLMLRHQCHPALPHAAFLQHARTGASRQRRRLHHRARWRSLGPASCLRPQPRTEAPRPHPQPDGAIVHAGRSPCFGFGTVLLHAAFLQHARTGASRRRRRLRHRARWRSFGPASCLRPQLRTEAPRPRPQRDGAVAHAGRSPCFGLGTVFPHAAFLPQAWIRGRSAMAAATCRWRVGPYRLPVEAPARSSGRVQAHHRAGVSGQSPRGAPERKPAPRA